MKSLKKKIVTKSEQKNSGMVENSIYFWLISIDCACRLNENRHIKNAHESRPYLIFPSRIRRWHFWLSGLNDNIWIWIQENM